MVLTLTEATACRETGAPHTPHTYTQTYGYTKPRAGHAAVTETGRGGGDPHL